MNRALLVVGMSAAWLLMAGALGCSGGSHRLADAAGEGRDTALARRLNAEAASMLREDPEGAAGLLEDALSADGFLGPAHNNRGVMLLDSGRLYEAALSFERAHQLMPGHPGPLVNLGLTLERGGRVEEAVGRYLEALEVSPGDLVATRALVRCQLRYGREDGQTEERLGWIAERSDGDWGDWARRRLMP